MCDCIDKVEEQLLVTGKNTKLDIPITFSMTGKLSANRVTISTCKRDEKKREKPLRMFASYCPFCGKEYESDTIHEPVAEQAELPQSEPA